ncbi:hypothetical protein GGR57DRAFT_520749 [Xylariaceae sp. FL1272]|nr:hypothetical protein GGR57DRAFT_520749 [Xylariaceae sp. FL1272]
MTNPILCTICGSSTAKLCSGCRSAAYCSLECQQTDWRTHRYLCRAFKEISPRPSRAHCLVVFFPMVNRSCKPQLRWVPTKEESTPGWFTPELHQIMAPPGRSRPSGGINSQIVRGNIMRGRPKFPDSLRIRYLEDFNYSKDEFAVNQTLHGGPAAVCADGWGDTFWRGPIVAYLSVGDAFDAPLVKDIHLTAYRDAIDYLAYFRETEDSMIDGIGSKTPLSRRVMADRSGKLKAVRIDAFATKLATSHPLLMTEGDDPLSIVEGLDETWVMRSYPIPKDATAEGKNNPYALMLLPDISRKGLEDGLEGFGWAKIPEWRRSLITGSVLVADLTKKDLNVSRVRAVSMAIEKYVVPLLNDPNVDEKAAMAALTEEAVGEFALPEVLIEGIGALSLR